MADSGEPAAPSAAVPPLPNLSATPADRLAAFETLLGVQVTLYDFADFFHWDDKRILPLHHGSHDRCGFCRHVKDDLGRLRDCLRCDMEPNVMRAQGPARWRRCHAGVWEVIYPMWDGAGFIGTMNVGCFRKTGEGPALVEEAASRPKPRARSAAPSRLQQEHRLLRELDPVTDAHLPALVETFAQGLIREVSRLHGGMQTSAAQKDSRRRRTRAIDLFFRTHHAPDAQLADLAAFLHLSTARTSQILRQELNTTFPALIRRTRLQEARRLLTVSELPIGKIAELAGFADRNYFCRVFTIELQMTPSEYRKRHARTLRA